MLAAGECRGQGAKRSRSAFAGGTGDQAHAKELQHVADQLTVPVAADQRVHRGGACAGDAPGHSPERNSDGDALVPDGDDGRAAAGEGGDVVFPFEPPACRAEGDHEIERGETRNGGLGERMAHQALHAHAASMGVTERGGRRA